MKKVLVASKNPVKINAARAGFESMFPHEMFEIEGLSAPSRVSDQPMSDEETIKGAMNRVQAIMQAQPKSDYWIGIEGGIEVKGAEMEAFAWVVVQAQSTKVTGKGRTGTFFLPPRIAELIHQGKDLGEADDIVFGRTNAKQQNGAVGLLTDDVVDRTNYYIQAVVFALIPFKNESLYSTV